MAGSIIGGIVSLAVVAIVFAQVLMPTLVTTNTTAWQASATSLWGTSQIISVVGFIFVLLAVFGIAV
jgi:hypothetical protein